MSKIKLSETFIKDRVKLALAEDLFPDGDITTNLLNKNEIITAKLVSNQKAIVQTKEEVQLSLELPQDSQFGLSYNHLSNASLGDKNPGANSYMFNFLKKF